MAKKPDGGFYIDVTCPGCGAGLQLQENFFVLRCSHCGSSLRVIMPDTTPAYVIKPKKNKREIRFRLDRYLKESGRPLTSSGFELERIYYPYWKVDALEVKTRGESISRVQTHKTIDILQTELSVSGIANVGRMIQACTAGNDPEVPEDNMKVSLVPFHINQVAGPAVDGIPYSIGMRTSYIKMSPYKREEVDDRFAFIPVNRSLEQIMEVLRGRTPPKGVEFADPRYYPCRRLVRPSGSIVYFPYFRCISGDNIFLIDGLNGRVASEQPRRDDTEIKDWPDPSVEFGQLDVVFHRCPTCGEDLPSRQSHIYICKNCQTVVAPGREDSAVPEVLMTKNAERGQDPMFPFWAFRLHPKSLAQIAQAPVTGPAPDRLVIPAFRIANFKVVRRLTQRITTAYPRFEKEKVTKFSKRFRPVDIGADEAQTLAEICIYCEKAKREPNLSPDAINLKPRGVELFYAPFHMQSYFYVDTVLNAVTFARHTVSE